MWKIEKELNDDEKNIVRRGRNAENHHVPKNATVEEYSYATAFEALIGYLYLTKQNVRLKEILEYFNTQEYLAAHLILKGGTAINFTVFNLPRLSVDIDMDYTPNDSRDNMLVARKQITGMIREYKEGERYTLSTASR